MSGFLLGSSILLLNFVESQMAAVAVMIASLMGIAVASANYWAVTQVVTPAPIVGRVIGAQNTIGNLAGVCAPIVTGWLVGRSNNFRAAIWFAGGALLIAVAAYWFLIREKDADALTTQEVGG